jgi:hypothetical protein
VARQTDRENLVDVDVIESGVDLVHDEEGRRLERVDGEHERQSRHRPVTRHEPLQPIRYAHYSRMSQVSSSSVWIHGPFATRELLHLAEALHGRHGGVLDAPVVRLVRVLQGEVRNAAWVRAPAREVLRRAERNKERMRKMQKK